MRTPAKDLLCEVAECGATGYSRRDSVVYCSKHFQRLYKHGTLTLTRNWGIGITHEERFWSRVAVTANPDKCWLYQGKPCKNGYALVTINYKRVYVHRYAWLLTKGAMPCLHLLHSCDTPRCVNPRHLREGTDADNHQDMMERGRSCKGVDRPQSKLNDGIVQDIRRRVVAGETQASVARLYNVCASNISHIMSRKLWRHVD